MPSSLAAGARIALRISILASGSSGNCTLLETERTRLLVDAGLGKKETLRRLAAIEKHVDRVDGILISHEHNDHCTGLAQLAREWHATVYLTEPTHDELRRILPERTMRRVSRVEYIRPGCARMIGDVEVIPFQIEHDAADPVGFAFRSNGAKVAIVTDLGYLSIPVRNHLRATDCLILESNHDLGMLKMGPYPWFIKQRVMSKKGHLSNHALGEFLSDPDGFDACARYLVLAHLSEVNNNPHVAEISAKEALGRRPAEAAFRGELRVAQQYAPLATIEL